MMSATTAFIIAALKMMLAVVVAYYVIEWLASVTTMPEAVKRACQAAVILIALLSILQDFDTPPRAAVHIGPTNPNSLTNPSVVR